MKYSVVVIRAPRDGSAWKRGIYSMPSKAVAEDHAWWINEIGGRAKVREDPTKDELSIFLQPQAD